MIKTPVVVKTEEDFDGRPIALLVQEASQYASTIYIQVGEKHINAKSIMGMMSLSLADGEEITVVTDGEDEQRAAEGIKNIFCKRQKIEWMDKTNKRRRAVHLCAVLSFHEMEITKYRGGDAV